MASNKDGWWVSRAALAVALIAPAIALAAAVVLHVFPMQRAWPFDVAVMTVGRYVAYGAVIVAVLAFVHALGDFKRRGLFAIIALLVAGGAAGLYVFQTRALAQNWPADVSTYPTDPPMDLVSVGKTSATCDGLTPVPSQLASEQVSAALQNVGFTITRSSLFSVTGVRQAIWFRETQEVAVRIRPGRTDIRVVTRNYRAHDGGAACRLALRVRAELQAGL